MAAARAARCDHSPARKHQLGLAAMTAAAGKRRERFVICAAAEALPYNLSSAPRPSPHP